MPLINCEVNFTLTWSSACAITNSTGAGRFEITDAKIYVPVVTLLAQDYAKFLTLSKSDFKRTINWNTPKIYAQNQYLNHLVDQKVRGVNRLFVFF